MAERTGRAAMRQPATSATAAAHVAYGFGLYRFLWRHASLSEVQRIFFAGATGAGATLFLGTVGLAAIGLARLPHAALALDAILAFGVLAASRLLVRFSGRRTRSANDRLALVVGAGAAGQLILRETRVNQRLNVGASMSARAHSQVARMIQRHWTGVLNAATSEITNAMAESVNSHLQRTKKRACGFRNRDRFREAILFHLGGLDLYPTPMHSTHTKS